MFWVDELKNDIIQKNDKQDYLVTDYKTPSGHIHIGALRGVIVHELVRQALEDEGKKAVFQYGFDDSDPMDGMPVYIDKSFEKYMGMPLWNIPAPDGKHESFADQYREEFEEIIHGLGYQTKFIRISECYKSGLFDEAIKIALDNAQEIRRIYKEVSGAQRGEDWYPFQVICPQCGKIGTTQVIDWDGKEVEFECKENLVKWARGCGYKGKIPPFKGNGKLFWKVEWAAKFFTFKSDVEGEGKDHSTRGGSRDVANHISESVYKHKPPYDIPYEFLLIGGAKMSSSKGLGATAKSIYDLLPPNILRFLFVRTRYKRAIEFNPEGKTISDLYDEYDRSSDAFFNDTESDLARAFYYAEFNPKDAPRYLMRFSKIANMLQMPRADIFEYAKEEKGNELTEQEINEIKIRIDIAKKWLDQYAPEEMKFSVKEKLPESGKNLTDEQKKFLTEILEKLQNLEKWDGQTIHSLLHEIKNEQKIPPKDAFSALYCIFIDKDSGPQAGWFLGALEKDFVITRLNEVIRDSSGSQK